MADHQVGELRLRLRGAASQAPVERFVSSVLEAAGDLHESRHLGRLVFVSRLALRWNLTLEELTDPGAISRYANEIADNLSTTEIHRPRTSASGNGFVIFRDEASWWACYLAARVERRTDDWVYASLRDKGVVLGSVAARGRDFAIEAADSATIEALNALLSLGVPRCRFRRYRRWSPN